MKTGVKKWGLRLLAVASLLAFYTAIAVGVWLFAQVDR